MWREFSAVAAGVAALAGSVTLSTAEEGAPLTPAQRDAVVAAEFPDVRKLEDPNYVAREPDAPALVEDCRDLLADPPTGNDPEVDRVDACRVVVAKASGDLDPGSYSDAELERALGASEAERRGLASPSECPKVAAIWEGVGMPADTYARPCDSERAVERARRHATASNLRRREGLTKLLRGMRLGDLSPDSPQIVRVRTELEELGGPYAGGR